MKEEIRNKMREEVRKMGMLEFAFYADGMIYYNQVKMNSDDDGIYNYQVSFFADEDSSKSFFKFDSMDDFLYRFEIFEITKIDHTSTENHTSICSLAKEQK